MTVTPFTPGTQKYAKPSRPGQFDSTLWEDATVVIAEGQRIAEHGIPWIVQDMIPAYGMVGMHVAATKVGKTTLAQGLAAHVAMGVPFLGRQTKRCKVAILAAEDPPQYTAYLARHLKVDPTWLYFYRQPLILHPQSLEALEASLMTEHIGLVLIASWQAVVRGLVREENDNAAGVRLMEQVKATARQADIAWLIDAHAGKAEDQSDEADPTKALRGASGTAGAADYLLSLRYANGPFGAKRRLSGKGKFVNFAPITVEYRADDGTYEVLGDSARVVMESIRQLVLTRGILSATPQAGTAIADQLVDAFPETSRTTLRRQVAVALTECPGVKVSTTKTTKQKRTLYSLDEVGCAT
jgi:hypothetical protein